MPQPALTVVAMSRRRLCPFPCFCGGRGSRRRPRSGLYFGIMYVLPHIERMYAVNFKCTFKRVYLQLSESEQMLIIIKGMTQIYFVYLADWQEKRGN